MASSDAMHVWQVGGSSSPDESRREITLAPSIESHLERVSRHVGQLEEIVATQQCLVANLEGGGDEHGAEMGRDRLLTMQRALATARDELQAERRRNEA